MKNFTLTLAALVCLAFATECSAQPVALYDPGTGNITFDMFDGVGGARLFSASEQLIPGVGADLGFSVTEKTAPLYTWVSFVSGGVTGDSLDAGNIVTPGTPVDDLTFDYKIGFGQTIVGPITVVPEPSTLMLTGLGLVGFISRRRRS